MKAARIAMLLDFWSKHACFLCLCTPFTSMAIIVLRLSRIKYVLNVQFNSVRNYSGVPRIAMYARPIKTSGRHPIHCPAKSSNPNQPRVTENERQANQHNNRTNLDSPNPSGNLRASPDESETLNSVEERDRSWCAKAGNQSHVDADKDVCAIWKCLRRNLVGTGMITAAITEPEPATCHSNKHAGPAYCVSDCYDAL